MIAVFKKGSNSEGKQSNQLFDHEAGYKNCQEQREITDITNFQSPSNSQTVFNTMQYAILNCRLLLCVPYIYIYIYIIWINVYIRSSDMYLRTILQVIHQPSITQNHLQITHLKYHSNIPWANGWTNWHFVFTDIILNVITNPGLCQDEVEILTQGAETRNTLPLKPLKLPSRTPGPTTPFFSIV